MGEGAGRASHPAPHAGGTPRSAPFLPLSCAEAPHLGESSAATKKVVLGDPSLCTTRWPGLGPPPEGVLGDLREDPEFPLPALVLLPKDDLAPDLPTDESPHGALVRGDPDAPPGAEGWVVEAQRAPLRNQTPRRVVQGPPDVLHGCPPQDPAEVDLSTCSRGRALPFGPGRNDLPISDELTEQHEALPKRWRWPGCT